MLVYPKHAPLLSRRVKSLLSPKQTTKQPNQPNNQSTESLHTLSPRPQPPLPSLTSQTSTVGAMWLLQSSNQHWRITINQRYFTLRFTNFGWKRFRCVDLPHFVYSFTSWWTFGLFSPISFCMTTGFHLGIYLGMELLGHVVTLCLTFWKVARTVFQGRCTILYSYQRCMSVLISPHSH